MNNPFRTLVASIAVATAGLIQVACDAAPRESAVGFPQAARVVPRQLLGEFRGVKVWNGGYGSAIARDPADRSVFYLLTDRGPNYDAGGDDKVFPVPSFTPRIGRFRLDGGELRLESVIELADAGGSALSGLPNPPGPGATGETPFGPDRAALAPDPDGLDPEGLVSLSDGTFWIADEYGPYLVQVDRNGRTLRRLSPFQDTLRLPAVLARRRPNRGLEGLAVLPGARQVLVAVLQSPLDNPKAAGRRSRTTRVLSFDPASGETHQYAYVLEETRTVLSDVTALTDGRLLVLEIDTDMPGDSLHPSTFKRIYRIDLRGATDIHDPADAAQGKRFGRRTLEELAPEELGAVGITPVSKTQVADLLSLGYRHNKAEGIAVIDDSTVAVANDDDFGIIEVDGGMATKLLPGSDSVDFNELFFVRLK